MRRNGFNIMRGLIVMLKPLTHVMALCICLGTLGYFCASAVTVLGVNLLLTIMEISPWNITFAAGAAAMLVCAAGRALLRYGEQMCGHFIAFRLLAIIRDNVFGALRRLAPAKLEGKGRGSLISLITSDIELLEVFYAHTVAPVCIAVIFSGVMTIFIGSFHAALGALACVSYIFIGCVIPLASSKMGRAAGMKARSEFGELNSYFLESLRGIKETLQFGQVENRAEEIADRTDKLNGLQKAVKKHDGAAASWSGAAVMVFMLAMIAAGAALNVSFDSLVLTAAAFSASFGPVLALSNLSAAMDQTLAAGERVLSLLEEEPETVDIIGGSEPDFKGALVKDLSFSYKSDSFDAGGADSAEKQILSGVSMEFPIGKIVAVTGRSGSGKSTLLKLLMRFWSAKDGSVNISDENIENINTGYLRRLESYMTQETDLFHDSIGDNIRVGRLGASQADVEEAAKKASVHDFITTLPQGYDTPVGELGETLSGGERQRIGLARAFLHDAPFMLLDEPTSNLDSLNEGVILKALADSAGNGSEKTIVIVSHRKSTLGVADISYKMEN